MEFEFGLSLDPSAVTLRHTLDDEEEEEDSGAEKWSDPRVVFSGAGSERVTKGGIIVMAAGEAASIFAKSHLELLSVETACAITSPHGDIFKDACFPSEKAAPARAHGEAAVSELYRVKGAPASEHGLAHLCLHERQLCAEWCNPWAEKVSWSSS